MYREISLKFLNIEEFDFSSISSFSFDQELDSCLFEVEESSSKKFCWHFSKNPILPFSWICELSFQASLIHMLYANHKKSVVGGQNISKAKSPRALKIKKFEMIQEVKINEKIRISTKEVYSRKINSKIFGEYECKCLSVKEKNVLGEENECGKGIFTISCNLSN